MGPTACSTSPGPTPGMTNREPPAFPLLPSTSMPASAAPRTQCAHPRDLQLTLETEAASWSCRFWADMYLAQFYEDTESASMHPTIAIDSGGLIASRGHEGFNPVNANRCALWAAPGVHDAS